MTAAINRIKEVTAWAGFGFLLIIFIALACLFGASGAILILVLRLVR